jgi:hypothetical protein
LIRVFQQCEKYTYLARNKYEILKRLLNSYAGSNDEVSRAQTLLVLSYVARLAGDSVDVVFIIRESMKSHSRVEQRAAILALDSLLRMTESPQLHFESLLGMILRHQEDADVSVWLVHLLRHMVYGPSVLMQVSCQLFR